MPKKKVTAKQVAKTVAKTMKQVGFDLSITKELIKATKALDPAVARIKAVLEQLKPETLPIGTLADLLYDLNQLSKYLGTLVTPFDDLLPATRKIVEDHFVNKLAVGESSGVQGHKARVQITESVVPVVAEADWPKFYAHILKTKEFELLNRAPNRVAIKERWEAHKNVPGVTKFHAKRVSCTTLGKRK